MLYENIKKLVEYGIQTGLTPECERIYTTNLLLELFQEDSYEDVEIDSSSIELEAVLEGLLDEAVKRGIIEDSIGFRDLFDTKIMNCLVPRPAQVQKTFAEKYEESPEAATEYFYKLSQDSNYIRRYRVKKDMKWKVDSPYGKIDITINLSKPEKDPKAIAAAGRAVDTSYPKCQLCKEAVGYAGRVNYPARENHRVIPVTIDGKQWWFQYSPYVYYNEHCIVFCGEHTPMRIDAGTFRKMFDFIDRFPHYMVGSNADLPIVGGSILSHDHFQGGNYEFPMAKAGLEEEFSVPGFEDVSAGIVRWPMSVIRLSSANRAQVQALAEKILNAWRGYTDEAAFVFAETEGEKHNTITPIARMRDGRYELDLVLRNNITTKEHPLGVYHPHEELHHIKKENIGLIEVMGLAILPARLQKELTALGEALVDGRDIRGDEVLGKHADWAEELTASYGSFRSDNVEQILRKETGKVFCRVLEDAGVYKCNEEGREAFRRFVRTLSL